MSITAAKTLGLPPGFSFRPDDNELIEFYLLPKLRGEPAWFPGVAVIEDDTAGNTLPWNLMKRHGLADDEDEAYFLVHTTTTDAKKQEAARQDRYCCDGDATWVSQRPVSGCSWIAGQEIKWRRNNLNLHKGRGKNGSGSTGWVMHEYTVTEPACPFLKICHISFTGHGKDRKRVPDDDESDCHAAGEPVAKRARVEADGNSNNGSTVTTDEGCYGMDQYASGDKEIDQSAEYIYPQQQQLVTLEARGQKLERIISDLCSADQDYATGAVGLDQNAQHILRGLEEALAGEQPRKQEPTIQTTISDQEQFFPTDQGISPSNQQFLDGAYLPTTDQQIEDAQLQQMQKSMPFAGSADVELYLEQVPTIEQEQHQPMEHQYGGDQQELDLELFWSNIEVDGDNIIFPEPFPSVI